MNINETDMEPPMPGRSKISVPALLGLFLLCQGCNSLPMAADRRAAWGEPIWGPAAEGLQCRLWPDRRRWQTGETPSFKFDLRNRGKRTFAFWPAQKHQLARIEFDGRWYRWPEPVRIDSQVWPLPPGRRYEGVSLSLHKAFGIRPGPGKHIVRIAFVLEGVLVVSNPVGIEITGRK